MKRLVFLLFCSMMAFWQPVRAYDFSATAPSGQILYYEVYAHPMGGGNLVVRIVHPNNNQSLPWYGYTSPTGILVIPDSVTHLGHTYKVNGIDNRAFYYCTGLTSVTIPNSVTHIDDFAFYDCTGLTSITIGNHVTSIGLDAFFGCSGLTSITIPNSVTSIGSEAFRGCTGLTSVVFNADSCTCTCSAGLSRNRVFYGCSNVNSFIFGNNVKAIPAWLCYEMYNLTSVTIPDSVTSIGSEAFYCCRNLTSITLLATAPPRLGDYVFRGVPSTVAFNIPCGSLVSYRRLWNSNYTFILDSFYNNYIETSGYTFSAASADETMGHVNVTTAPTCQSPTAVISATAAECFHFDHWSTGSTANPYTIHLVSDSTVTAYFLPGYTLTVNVNDESMGSVTFPNGNTADYLDTIMAVAIPTAHHHVLNWQGQGVVATSVNKDTVWVRMTSNRTLRCIFAIDSYNTVDVSVNDPTMGTATVNGAASATVTSGETVALAATANEGYHFVRWNDNNTEATRTVVVTADISFTAFFESDVPEGIDGVKTTDAKIYARDGQIVVEGSDGELVSLYDPAGRLLAVRREVVHGSPLQFDIPASGAYLVRIGNCTARKVVVIR